MSVLADQMAHKRRRNSALFAAGVVLAVCLALVAPSFMRDASAGMGKWSWATVPGDDVIPDENMIQAARHSRERIDEGTIRALSFSSAPGNNQAIYAGAGLGGAVCLSARMSQTITSFNCLDENAASHAVVFYSEFGGDRSDVVRHALIVGIARSDVARLTVARRDGTEVQLPLGRW